MTIDIFFVAVIFGFLCLRASQTNILEKIGTSLCGAGLYQKK
jgi:hypothetical protein